MAGFGDVAFEHFAFMIDRAPEVVLDTIDLHKGLIQMPLLLGMLAHKGGLIRPDLPGEDRTKSITLSPDAFVADIDPILVE